MTFRARLTAVLLTAISAAVPAAASGAAAAVVDAKAEIAAGRKEYMEGEFRKAAAHFAAATRLRPEDAGAFYWAGIAYERMADIATPFGGRLLGRARGYLRSAARLAPESREYRQALFDFLLDSSDSSRSALPEAAALLETVAASDPDRDAMCRRLAEQRKANSSAEARLGRMLLLAPRGAARMAGQ